MSLSKLIKFGDRGSAKNKRQKNSIAEHARDGAAPNRTLRTDRAIATGIDAEHGLAETVAGGLGKPHFPPPLHQQRSQMFNFMPDILAPIRINREWLMPKKCMIDKCNNEMEGPICPAHWFKLTIELRHKWWKETDYGNKEASDELKKEIQAALSSQTA